MSRDHQHHQQHGNAARVARRAADELLIRAIFGASFCDEAIPTLSATGELTGATAVQGTVRDAQAIPGRSGVRAAA